MDNNYFSKEIEQDAINSTRFQDVYDAIASQRLFYKKTDGGAEYLCTEAIEGTNVGDVRTTIVRLDGGAELF